MLIKRRIVNSLINPIKLLCSKYSSQKYSIINYNEDKKIQPRDHFQLNNNKNNLLLQWKQKPSTILIVKKPNDKQTDEALLEMVDWLNQQKSYNIIIEPHNKPEVIEKLKEVTVFNHETWKGLKNQVDMVITLGGDGSLLHVSSLFNQTVPPIISFSMGTLGFLLPFHIKNYKSDLKNFINGKIQLIKRDRLACSFLDSDNQPKLFSWTGESSGSLNCIRDKIVYQY